VAGPATRVFLVRHGAVDPAWHGRIYGALDVPLSAAGRDEARAAAERLAHEPLAAAVSSGLARADFGAECLRAARGLERLVDPDLRELERGDWAGLGLDELERRHPGAWAAWYASPATVRTPGGESLDDLAARAVPALERWVERYSGRSIALVTHGWVVRVLICHVLGAPNALAPRLDVRTGDIALLEWTAPATARLVGFALDRPPEPEQARSRPR